MRRSRRWQTAGEDGREVGGNGQQCDASLDDTVAPRGIGSSHDDGSHTDTDPTHGLDMGKGTVAGPPEQAEDKKVHNEDQQGGVLPV